MLGCHFDCVNNCPNRNGGGVSKHESVTDAIVRQVNDAACPTGMTKYNDNDYFRPKHELIDRYYSLQINVISR